MTPQEADKHLKRIQNYLGSTDSMTQFWDACKIAEDALYEVKKLNKSGVKSSNAFERLPLHWKLLYYYAGGIITGLLLHYCF